MLQALKNVWLWLKGYRRLHKTKHTPKLRDWKNET